MTPLYTTNPPFLCHVVKNRIKWQKSTSEKTVPWQKEKERLQIATYRPSLFSFDVFVVFIHLPWVLKLKITRKLSNEIMNTNY